MSGINQFDNILPVARLKIAALDSCLDFAAKVDQYLVNFRRKANTQHRDNIHFQEYAQDSYLVKCSCPPLRNGGRPRDVMRNPSAEAIFLLW